MGVPSLDALRPAQTNTVDTPPAHLLRWAQLRTPAAPSRCALPPSCSMCSSLISLISFLPPSSLIPFLPPFTRSALIVSRASRTNNALRAWRGCSLRVAQCTGPSTAPMSASERCDILAWSKRPTPSSLSMSLLGRIGRQTHETYRGRGARAAAFEHNPVRLDELYYVEFVIDRCTVRTVLYSWTPIMHCIQTGEPQPGVSQLARLPTR